MKATIEKAKSGDAAALEHVVRHVQDQVHRLALRMLADVSAAEDATQDILIRIVTKLSTYRGDSKFETWVYRVAINHLLNARKVLARDPGLSFDQFEADLLSGLVDESDAAEDKVLLNELRVKCTMAMLLCLDRDHRAAYVLGDVLELQNTEAAEALDIAPATYRKRLSRARQKVQDFTAKACGLANAQAPCHCTRRLAAAKHAGRVGQGEPTLAAAPNFKDISDIAAKTKAALVTAKLQRATGPLQSGQDIASKVLDIVNPPGSGHRRQIH